VFAVAQHSPGREWLAARTEVLINHLRNCERQPPAVCQKAEDHKQSTTVKSPRKSAPSRHDFGEGSTSVLSVSPYARPPVLHVQTPLDGFQSAYMLAVPPPSSQIGLSNYTQHGRPQSVVSSSGSSLTPSDSISVCLSAPRSRARHSRSRVASYTAEITPPDAP